GAGTGRPEIAPPRRVEGLNRQADKDRETIRELENRLFIVEDKLETLTVAQAKKHAAPPEPELPVVTKHKAPEPEPDPPGPDVIITLDESGNLSAKPARRRGAARPPPPAAPPAGPPVGRSGSPHPQGQAARSRGPHRFPPRHRGAVPPRPRRRHRGVPAFPRALAGSRLRRQRPVLARRGLLRSG